jgi:hypothetical protein
VLPACPGSSIASGLWQSRAAAVILRFAYRARRGG